MGGGGWRTRVGASWRWRVAADRCGRAPAAAPRRPPSRALLCVALCREERRRRASPVPHVTARARRALRPAPISLTSANAQYCPSLHPSVGGIVVHGATGAGAGAHRLLGNATVADRTRAPGCGGGATAGSGHAIDVAVGGMRQLRGGPRGEGDLGRAARGGGAGTPIPPAREVGRGPCRPADDIVSTGRRQGGGGGASTAGKSVTRGGGGSLECAARPRTPARDASQCPPPRSTPCHAAARGEACWVGGGGERESGNRPLADHARPRIQLHAPLPAAQHATPPRLIAQRARTLTWAAPAPPARPPPPPAPRRTN